MAKSGERILATGHQYSWLGKNKMNSWAWVSNNEDQSQPWGVGVLSSVAQSCPILCMYPMEYSTPGFPVHHHLPELAQTHIHPVGDAIQLSHALPSLSLPAFNLSQHQGLF